MVANGFYNKYMDVFIQITLLMKVFSDVIKGEDSGKLCYVSPRYLLKKIKIVYLMQISANKVLP